MTTQPDPHEYPSVPDAERDINNRLDKVVESGAWLPAGLPAGVIPSWTTALTSFSVNCTVTPVDDLALDQIRATFRAVEEDLARRAAELGSGTMATLEPSHILFMVLVRQLQREHADKANLNPHKLRILLDRRYTVE